MSSFLSSEISSRAEDMLFTFLLSMSVEHTDPFSRSLFCPDMEESVANSYLGTSPSSFAAGRAFRKKTFIQLNENCRSWCHGRHLTSTHSLNQSNPTGSVPAFLTNTAPAGFSSPHVTWHKMTHCYCTWQCILNSSPKTFFFLQIIFVSLHLKHSFHCERKKSWL